jgi:hypothetical protein
VQKQSKFNFKKLQDFDIEHQSLTFIYSDGLVKQKIETSSGLSSLRLLELFKLGSLVKYLILCAQPD